MKNFGLFSAMTLLVASASAGHIGCTDGSLNGGVGNIPVHNVAFQIFATDTVNVCDAQNEDCAESAGDAASFQKDVVKCVGQNGKTTSVHAWLALHNGIYYWNIQAPGGKKYYCKGTAHGCTYSGCNRDTGFCS